MVTPELIRRVEQALTHALASSLGPELRPLPGFKKDEEAVKTLLELREAIKEGK